MIYKIAYRNAKRAFEDYLIYILTMSLAIAFIFAINSLVFQPEIQNLSRVSSGYFSLMLGASGIVAFVVANLVKYMTGYILDRSSKKIGIYMLMGIESKDISKMYWLEQIILGLLSTIIGLFLGKLILEIVKAVIFRFLNIGYYLTFTISLKAILITLLLVLALYFFSLLFNTRNFRKRKIIEWINRDKVNEVSSFGSKKQVKNLFFLSIIVMAVSVFTIYDEFKRLDSIPLIIIAFVFLGVSIYGITFGIPTILVRWALKRNRQYTMMIISVRFFYSKINEMAKKLGTLTLLLVISLSLFLIGMIFANFYICQIEEINNYDLLFRGEDINYVEEINEIVKNYGIEKGANIHIFEDNEASVHRLFTDTNLVSKSRKMDTVISLSDYNSLRRLTGNDEISIPKGGFVLQLNSTSSDVLEKLVVKTSYKVMERDYQLIEIYNDPMSTVDLNFTNYYIILNDEDLKGYEHVSEVHLWQLKNNDYKSLHDDLLQLAIEKEKGTKVVINNGKKEVDLDNNFTIMGLFIEYIKTSIVVMILSFIYIAMIFCFILATVLATSLVLDASKYKNRYDMLNKMGLDLWDIKKLILKQICLVFGFPVFLAIPITMAIVYSVSQIFTGYISKGFIIRSMAPTAIMFFIVYGTYMLVTYISYKNVVMEEFN